MRARLLLIVLSLVLLLLAGCAKPASQASPSPSPAASPSPSPPASPSPGETDAVTSASLVNTEAGFMEAISKDGVWIVCLLQDLTIDRDLVVDGDFMNTKDPPASQRKLAFYSQDENRNVTDRYTLTAPTMTVNSIDCSIQHGTFRGDLYVAGKNFQLVDMMVDGNLYFLNAEAESTFKMDDTSTVTGVQQLKTA